MAWYRTGDKPWPETTMILFTNTYDSPSLIMLTHWPLGDLNKILDTYIIFKLISGTDGWDISCKIALRWMPLDLTDDKSTLVQVMTWCRQATSHYLSRCWPRFMSPQWVNHTPEVTLDLSCSNVVVFSISRPPEHHLHTGHRPIATTIFPS